MSNQLLLAIAIATAACVPPAQGPYPSGPTTAGPGAPRSRQITINGAAPDANEAQTLAQLEASAGGTLPDGAYWYDPVSGAFGAWGQPTAAVIAAGLDLGPPLPADASAGDTGVFINNRQLPVAEVQSISNLVGAQLLAGRYFLDAQGNAGKEGGPILINLVQVANARRAANNRAANTAGGGGGVHMTSGSGASRSWFDSDGKGCKVFTSSSGQTVSSGC